MSEPFLDGKVVLHSGDCLDVLKTLEPNSVDAIVTDPPYGLEFMGKHWDHGVPGIQYWKQILRVLKPGGHLLSFGGTRTYHRMACAIEDAGFEIRDSIQWLYGSGFPKSLDVSKAIDKAAGAEREQVGTKKITGRNGDAFGYGPEQHQTRFAAGDIAITAPATDTARKWQGFGTALKPACELIVLARKPLSESTVAANVLKWGTGALNIDGCRVETDADTSRPQGKDICGGNFGGGGLDKRSDIVTGGGNGRWPANVIHDGSDEVVGAFPDAPGQLWKSTNAPRISGNVYGDAKGPRTDIEPRGDTGSAARFFYTAKADADDRLGSKHPTVKPIDLIEYLEVLVTPPGGTILDPFAGTGTAGEAAFRRGFKAILIEREAEYCNDIRRRMALCLSGPDERTRESIKARMKDKPVDAGPLFAGSETPPARADRFTESSRTNNRADGTEVVTPS